MFVVVFWSTFITLACSFYRRTLSSASSWHCHLLTVSCSFKLWVSWCSARVLCMELQVLFYLLFDLASCDTPPSGGWGRKGRVYCPWGWRPRFSAWPPWPKGVWRDGKRAESSGSSLDLSRYLAKGAFSFFFFPSVEVKGYWRGTGFVSAGPWCNSCFSMRLSWQHPAVGKRRALFITHYSWVLWR